MKLYEIKLKIKSIFKSFKKSKQLKGMEIDKYEEIKYRSSLKTFYNKYLLIKKWSYMFSYLAQIAIIFLGFFFISKVIIEIHPSMDVWVSQVIAIVFLGGWELLKRSITDKWAEDAVTAKKNKNEFLILAFFSIILYAGSFYVSLNGALKFSDRNADIKIEASQNIQASQDSVINVYQNRINILEKSSYTNDSLKKIDPIIVAYNEASAAFNRRPYAIYKESMEKLYPQYQEAIARYNLKSDRINESVSLLEKERNIKIKEVQSNIQADASIEKVKSNKNQNLFYFMSILFELIIIGGLYFNRYFDVRSLQDWEDKLKSDPKLSQWYKWNKMLKILYQIKFNELQTGASAPIAKDMVGMCKLENILVSESEVKDYYKSLSNIGILRTSGPKKYIYQSYNSAKELLGKQFDVTV